MDVQKICICDLKPKIDIKNEKMQWTLFSKWIIYEPKRAFWAFEVNARMFWCDYTLVIPKKQTYAGQFSPFYLYASKPPDNSYEKTPEDIFREGYALSPNKVFPLIELLVPSTSIFSISRTKRTILKLSWAENDSTKLGTIVGSSVTFLSWTFSNPDSIYVETNNLPLLDFLLKC